MGAVYGTDCAVYVADEVGVAVCSSMEDVVETSVDSTATAGASDTS